MTKEEYWVLFAPIGYREAGFLVRKKPA